MTLGERVLLAKLNYLVAVCEATLPHVIPACTTPAIQENRRVRVQEIKDFIEQWRD